MATTKSHRVGDATVIKILELALEYTEAGDLYPDQANLSTAVEETSKLWPGSPQTRGPVCCARASISGWCGRRRVRSWSIPGLATKRTVPTSRS